MKIAVFSDIHSNYPAFQKVIKHAREQGVKAFISTGDQIGYLPYPAEVVEELYRLKKEGQLWWITGNHEQYFRDISFLLTSDQTVKGLNGRKFKDAWAEVCLHWKADEAAAANHEIKAMAVEIYTRWKQVVRDYGIDSMLRGMAEMEAYQGIAVQWFKKELEQANSFGGPLQIDAFPEFTLVAVHGSLNNPAGDVIFPEDSEMMKFGQVHKLVNEYPHKKPLVLCCGHTHIPLFLSIDSYSKEDGNEKFRAQAVVSAADATQSNPDGRLPVIYGEPQFFGSLATIINPGSLGFPADGDSWAKYALIDTEPVPTVIFHRVPFEDEEKEKVLEQMKNYNYLKELREMVKASSRSAQNQLNGKEAPNMGKLTQK